MGAQPAPIKWLDSFAMRSFTNDQVFDDTLPVRDGLIEIGAKVPLELLRSGWKIGSAEELFAQGGAAGRE